VAWTVQKGDHPCHLTAGSGHACGMYECVQACVVVVMGNECGVALHLFQHINGPWPSILCLHVRKGLCGGMPSVL